MRGEKGEKEGGRERRGERRMREKAKERHYEHIKSLEYSFKPVLTEGSKKYISKSLNKYENKDEFYKRLSNSKRMKNNSQKLSKMLLNNKCSWR